MEMALEVLRYATRAIAEPEPAAPMIALAGASCAGKSSIGLEFAGQSVLAFLRETYTRLRLDEGVPAPDPEDPESMRRMQYLCVAAQMHFEREAARTAAASGKKLIVDRPILDAAAYLPGGFEELTLLTGLTRERLYARYMLVVHLGAPPEEVYLQVHARNPARLPPDYNLVLRREQAHRETLRGHPNYQFIPYHPSWEEKKSQARRIILGC